MTIKEQLLTGRSAAKRADSIASLRLDIFREYPYLYDGNREDELDYLQMYAKKPGAFVVEVTESGTIVGAATGIPLCHETEELIKPFSDSSYSIEEIFYVGELLFYPAYRNLGLGKRLITRIEQHVRSLGKYRYLLCATIVRSDSHPSCPAGYLPIDSFLARTGFSKLVGITTNLSWREIDGIKQDHAMQFWLKPLSQVIIKDENR